MVKGQPTDRSVFGGDRQPRFSDCAKIGHQGGLGDGHAQREARAARGELQIAEAVSAAWGRQRLAARRGQVADRAAGEEAETFAGFGEPTGQRRRAKGGPGAGGGQQAANVRDIWLLAAEWRRKGRRSGREARVLTGEKGAQEIAVALRRESHPVARPQPGGEHASSQRRGVPAQRPVVEHLGEFAARSKDVDARRLVRGVVQRFDEIDEIPRPHGATRGGRRWDQGRSNLAGSRERVAEGASRRRHDTAPASASLSTSARNLLTGTTAQGNGDASALGQNSRTGWAGARNRGR